MTTGHTGFAGQNSGENFALRTQGLLKEYGGKVAVNGVTWGVPRGSLYGLIGPNGAGKTTLLSMATGLVRPSSGNAYIGDKDVWSDPVESRRDVGVLPDGPALPPSLPGGKALQYAGVIQGLEPTVAAERCADLLDVMGLTGAEDQQISTYSAGMTKKIGLAGALIHSPSLLVLDEPLEAVDPVSAKTIRTLLQNYVERGGTAIVSSHSLPLIEQVCTHVAILDGGVLRSAGTLAEVRGDADLESAVVALADPDAVPRDLGWLGV